MKTVGIRMSVLDWERKGEEKKRKKRAVTANVGIFILFSWTASVLVMGTLCVIVTHST